MAEVSVEQQVSKEVKGGGTSDKLNDLLITHPEMQNLLSLAAR